MCNQNLIGNANINWEVRKKNVAMRENNLMNAIIVVI